MIEARCGRCDGEVDDRAAILIGPPGGVRRYLCGQCYRDVVGFIRRPDPEED